MTKTKKGLKSPFLVFRYLVRANRERNDLYGIKILMAEQYLSPRSPRFTQEKTADTRKYLNGTRNRVPFLILAVELLAEKGGGGLNKL